jgi:predicted MFS family arabinose efflux permease
LAAGALVALALALLSMAVTTLVIPETRREPGSHAGGLSRLDAAQRWGLRVVLSGAFISMTAQAAFLVTLPLYLLATLRYTAQQASIFLTALVGGAALFQLLGLPPLLRRLRERRACLVGFGLVSIGGVVCAEAGTLPVVAVGAALAVAGVVTLNPAYTSLIGSVSNVDQGTLMGLNQSIASAGQMIGPLFGYGALALAGAGGYGWLCVFLALGGAAVTLRLRDKADV